jgi:hypothetical protein
MNQTQNQSSTLIKWGQEGKRLRGNALWGKLF